MNESLWISTSKENIYERLDTDVEADYLIIGGGIVGINTAYLLARSNLNVLLIDANRIGEGCSGRTTGKISTQHNIIYSKIKKKYNLEVAKAYYDANNNALNLIESIIKNNNIDCDFERIPSYIFTEDINRLSELQKEYDVCEELGIDCEYHRELDIPFSVKGAVSFKNQGQFNPKKYIDALGKIIINNGGKIYENTPLVDIEKGENNTYRFMDINGNTILAKNVVMASHSPWYDDLGLYFARLRAERSYLVSGVINSSNKIYEKGMYINIENPRRSIRYYNEEGENLILIGGENHKVGKDNEDVDYYEILKAVGRDKFGVEEFKYQWSAQDYITTDFIPYIGYLNVKDENIYVGTGFSKWGMTNGIVAAMVISDLIIKKSSEYEETFSMDRLGDLLSFDMVKRNIEVGYEYVKGKFKKGNNNIYIDKGEGKIVKIDGKKYGAYRSEEGDMYIVDITCTHLGCELIFNNKESSWDCPCHGSRFNYNGEILEGPATEPLRAYGEISNDINPHIL